MAGMPSPSLSQRACRRLAHSAVMRGLALARRMKWRRWNWVTALVVPAAVIMGTGSGACVKMFVVATRSSSLNPLPMGSFVLGASNDQSFCSRVLLMSMNPTLSATDIRASRSAVRAGAASRQSS